MRKQRQRLTFFIIFTLIGVFRLYADRIEGTVIDDSNSETLIGASVQIVGTNSGAVTDFDGRYMIENLNPGRYSLEIRYIGYKTKVMQLNVSGNTGLNIGLEAEGIALADVQVVGRRSRESEASLAIERKESSVAVEHLGVKEMSLKGIGNIEEGVKKISGISIADAGQLIVRGLGDRYSTTTLNGLPIASPNPDNKLIPLDLFPASVISNISVNKTYRASAFADYSGAHINIETREHTGENYVSFGVSAGSNFYTIGQPFYIANKKGSLFSAGRLDPSIKEASRAEFNSMVKSNDIFGSNFSVKKTTGLPDVGINIGAGQTWDLTNGKLSLVASGNLDHGEASMPDGFVSNMTATGTVLNHFKNNQYKEYLNAMALAGIGYQSNNNQSVNYTFFYARNAESTYARREGYDSERVDLIGSNSVYHVYSLINNQLQGSHKLSDRWDLKWNGSFGYTTSDEPDRKQVMFRKMSDGTLDLFKLNAQETMRYYGELSEWEAVGDVNSTYIYGRENKSKLHFGLTYKQKGRDYASTRFYYNLRDLPVQDVTDIYNTDAFLNQENIANGTISITRDMQPKDRYSAMMRAAAAYLETDYIPIKPLTINIGLRLEYVDQHVDYATDGGAAKESDLKDLSLFPALNVKYELTPKHVLRFAASRTVTRPSFIEMAPFLYQESYGGPEMRGNADLQNGYNYNFDLKYEFLFNEQGSDLIAITGYFKQLLTPIERIQEFSGGAAVHSFRNSEAGLAGGFEIELKKQIIQDLRIGANFSYMYTNVKLIEGGGVYTSSSRALQGASPYLANADLSYTPSLGEERRLNLALLYNLQGPRIHAVGIMGLGDVKQKDLHTLNFSAGYEFNRKAALKLQINNILNSDILFEQLIPQTGATQLVEKQRRGMSAEISFTYTLFN